MGSSEKDIGFFILECRNLLLRFDLAFLN